MEYFKVSNKFIETENQRTPNISIQGDSKGVSNTKEVLKTKYESCSPILFLVLNKENQCVQKSF